MINHALLREIDTVYRQLEEKRIEVISALKERLFEVSDGWYNGHYHKGENGEWQKESYPIAVITVKGLCDIEIGFEQVSVSTKLKRGQALVFSFDKVKDYTFEAYGVRDYLCDFYLPGSTIQDMKEKIVKSNETEIGFSFVLPFDRNVEQLLVLIELLKRDKFYY